MVGIDSNHFLGPRAGLDIFPRSQDQATTCKKRSSMQCQFSKANQLVQEAKDHILTNGTLADLRTLDAQGADVAGQLLPNERHPYDHFFVVGRVGCRAPPRLDAAKH